jgi:hypothetical protein
MASGFVRRLPFVVALVLAGCGTGLIPGESVMPPGSRQWIVNVDNQSAEVARLIVAEDAQTMGATVGTADPPIVPPNTRRDVVFMVPPGQGWAIFVNPTPQRGPLLIAPDVPPDVSGRLPITFIIDPRGEPGMMVPGNPGPGWLGE